MPVLHSQVISMFTLSIHRATGGQFQLRGNSGKSPKSNLLEEGLIGPEGASRPETSQNIQQSEQ